MGKEIIEDTVLSLEDMLGLDVDAHKDDDKEASSDAPTLAKEEADAQKEQEQVSPPNTTTLTDEQLSINQEITKIDIQIEALQKNTVDIGVFYDNLEDELSEEEQALEFSDKSAYMKLVSQKAQEYEKNNSKSDEIQALEEEKKEKQLVYERQSAIVAVSQKYPAYNHEKVLNYFTEELSQKQQQAIFDASESYTDVYVKSYESYMQSNPQNILQEKAPNIPDVNNVRKDIAKGNDTDDGLRSEDQMLQEALGL